MGFLELFLIAVGLSMDAFAVSVCKGLCMRELNVKNGIIISLFFGLFQGGMPLIGWALGIRFERYITNIDHWIAFGLLVFLGVKMIYEALQPAQNDDCGCAIQLDYKELTTMAIATSIDALAVGITFAFLSVSILPSVGLIGITTFVLSFAGVVLGNKFGAKYKAKAEMAGGIILVLMGTRILMQHLNIL